MRIIQSTKKIRTQTFKTNYCSLNTIHTQTKKVIKYEENKRKKNIKLLNKKVKKRTFVAN